MELVFASGNENKTKEIANLLPEDFKLKNLRDIGFLGELPETEQYLEGNALQKAAFVFDNYGLNCFADDTGLEINALRGAPGVMSARYAGYEKDANANMDKVLREMEGESKRKARFRTVIALIIDGKEKLFEGTISGEIAEKKSGKEGFGYDPIFIPEGHDKSFAEMSLAEKNKMSHRATAFRRLVDYLKVLS